MNNFQLLFAAGFPTLVVLVGILLNRQDSTSLRSEFKQEIGSLRSDLGGLRSDLGGRIDMLTGKVIELTDRVSHLETRMGK